MITKLNYFGTSLNQAGHFIWELEGNNLKRPNIDFSDIPFNPEELNKTHELKGTVHYIKFDNYFICAIAGSCRDERSGSKSVFWTTEPIRFEEFGDIITSIPIGKRIIDQMPFKVKW